MKRIFFTFAVLSLFQSNAQKEEKIVINNRRSNISIEAGGIQSVFNLDGDSKYYNKYQYYTPGIKDVPGISIGSNIEYHLVKNSTFASLNAGLHYITHGDPVFISKGNISDNFVKSHFDDMGYIKVQSIRVPLYIHIRFFKFMEDEGVALEAGTNFDYLLSASLKPGKLDDSKSSSSNQQVASTLSVADVFNKFNVNPFAGFRFQFNRLYINGRYSIVPTKKLFTNSYANYNSTNAHFEESFTSFGLGVLF